MKKISERAPHNLGSCIASIFSRGSLKQILSQGPLIPPLSQLWRAFYQFSVSKLKQLLQDWLERACDDLNASQLCMHMYIHIYIFSFKASIIDESWPSVGNETLAFIEWWSYFKKLSGKIQW